MSYIPAVLMLGWEYPPHNSGGLGQACHGLTQALAGQGHQIYFTLPFNYGQSVAHMQMVQFPVAEPHQFAVGGSWSVYGQANYPKPNSMAPVMAEIVDQYTQKLVSGSDNLLGKTDIIHAHDWMTFPAGLALKQTSHKPLITHIHSTEADRVIGAPGNAAIEKIEWQGLQGSDQVITVSQYTKNILVKHYGVDPRKIMVVHNGIETHPSGQPPTETFAQNRPLIAFMGRLTSQKGLPYFLLLAKKILTLIPDTLFVIAGNGDMYHELMFATARQGLTGHVLFSGFIRDVQREKLLARADVFVMPSLSEPFGLVALEAAAHQIPVVMSDQTGVAEVLRGSIQVPLSDLDAMTAAVVKLLTVPSFRTQVITQQTSSLKNTTWSQSARTVQKVYQRSLASPPHP